MSWERTTALRGSQFHGGSKFYGSGAMEVRTSRFGQHVPAPGSPFPALQATHHLSTTEAVAPCTASWGRYLGLRRPLLGLVSFGFSWRPAGQAQVSLATELSGSSPAACLRSRVELDGYPTQTGPAQLSRVATQLERGLRSLVRLKGRGRRSCWSDPERPGPPSSFSASSSALGPRGSPTGNPPRLPKGC